MTHWFGVVLGYLVLAFAGSALLVRRAPDRAAARILRRRLALFPLLPVLLAGAGMIGVLGLLARAPRPFVRLFEALSGRRQYVRYRIDPYGYEAPGRAHSDRVSPDRADDPPTGR